MSIDIYIHTEIAQITDSNQVLFSLISQNPFQFALFPSDGHVDKLYDQFIPVFPTIIYVHIFTYEEKPFGYIGALPCIHIPNIYTYIQVHTVT